MSQATVPTPTGGDPTILHVLDARRSVPAMQLCEPGPDTPQLLRMLRSAVRVPDHGKRMPWRFLRIQGEARAALGEHLARRSRERNPDASDAAVDKERHRFSHAPVIVGVIARQGPDSKIPASERLLSAGCICFALLQAAQAFGFGACWLTGWAAYDPGIRRVLGIADDEAVAGFIHIGTIRQNTPERDRPDPADLLTDWTPQ
ncbi:MAG: nitroreductase family protein [Pseudomonadota bacterium]